MYYSGLFAYVFYVTFLKKLRCFADKRMLLNPEFSTPEPPGQSF